MKKSSSAENALKFLERITFITDRNLLVEDCYPERFQNYFTRSIMLTVNRTKILEKAEELFNEKDLLVLDKELEIDFGNPSFSVIKVTYTEEGVVKSGIACIRSLLYQAMLSN
jgi:hypothetical protein